VRGGGWNNIQRNVRAAYRNNNTPDNRNNNLGCRVCVVPHLIFRGFDVAAVCHMAPEPVQVTLGSR
jgi:hypothetical protein